MKINALIIFVCLSLVSCGKTFSPGQSNDSEENGFKYYFTYLYTDGIRLRILGNTAEALKHFEICLKIEPGNDAVLFQIAQVMLQNGNLNGAKYYLLEAVKAVPENIWYNIMLQKIYAQQNNSDSALIFIKKAILIDSDNEMLMLQLAEHYSERGNYEESAKILAKLEKKYGLNENNALIVVKTYMDAKDYKSTENTLIKLTEAFPEENIYKGMLAEVYRNLGLDEKASQIYADLMEKNPDDGKTMLWISDFLAEAGNYKELFYLLERIIDNKSISEIEKLAFFKGLIEKEKLIKDKKEELEEVLMKLEFKYPKSQNALLLRPDLYMKAGENKKAEERLKEIISADRRNYFAWETLLFLYSETRNIDMLYKYAGECATEFNLSLPAKILFASAAMEKGEYERAIEELRKAKIIAGNNTEALIQALSLEADTYYRMKEYKKAFEKYENALVMDYENIMIMNNYAYLLAERNTNLGKAEEMALKVIAKEPENTTYLDTYAWVLFKKGKIKKAEEVMFDIIVNKGGKNPEHLEHYGLILIKRKKCNEAVKYLQEALKADPEKKYLIEEIKNCTGKR